MTSDSDEEKAEKKWLMSQIQYYIEKILEARREDMNEIENRGKEFSDNLTRERNIITSAAAFIIAAVIPILLELSGKQPYLILLLIVVLSITGILFTLLSVVKHKILVSFSIIKAAYSLPVGKLSFIRDKYIGLTIFRELRDELTSKNFENLFTYLQIVGGSKLDAIGQLQHFSDQKSIPTNVRRFLKNRVFTEQHIGEALYEFFLLNQDRLKNDPLIISLEEEYPTLMGGKSIFESWINTNPIKRVTRYKTKLNISLLIPATWEIIKDVKYSRKYRSSFHMRHGWHKLSEFKIFKKKSVTNMQTYIDAVKKNLIDDETITLTETSQINLLSKIPAYKFIYESKDEPLFSATMEVYFSYSEQMYEIAYESISKSDFLKLLPEVEEIINSIQAKNS